MRRRVLAVVISLGLGAFYYVAANPLAFGGPTSPTDAKTLLAYPAGKARCPFAVVSGATVVGEIYCDGGASGPFLPHIGSCPFDIDLPDGGLLFDFGCDSSINLNAVPVTGNPFLVFGNGAMFVGPFVQGSDSLADGGGATFTVASDLGQSFGTAGLPGIEATLPLYSTGAAAHLTWNGTRWLFDRPAYDSDYITSDAGFCFHDGTCQTTKATSSYSPWIDGGNGSATIQNLPLDGGEVDINMGRYADSANGTIPLEVGAEQFSGNGYVQFWEYSPTNYLLLKMRNGGGNQITWTTSGTGQGMYFDPGNTSSYKFGVEGTGVQIQGVPLIMNTQQITGLAAATAATGAPQWRQCPAQDEPLGTTTPQGLHAGTATLSAGSAAVTFNPAYGAAPVCTCTDASSILAAKCVATNTTLTITVTAGGSDTVDWICIGTR